jgi:hypothetical protein
MAIFLFVVFSEYCFKREGKIINFCHQKCHQNRDLIYVFQMPKWCLSLRTELPLFCIQYLFLSPPHLKCLTIMICEHWMLNTKEMSMRWWKQAVGDGEKFEYFWSISISPTTYCHKFNTIFLRLAWNCNNRQL